MKSKKSDPSPTFIQYDDENIEHVMSGPDYGQVDTGSKCSFWNEIDSPEYNDFVDYLTEKIVSRKVSIFKS
jgi:hypothetical protein